MDTIFISGEAVNLCIPSEEDFDQWASWFNCEKTTKYLEQGKYPNTVALQKDFYSNVLTAGRFLLLIKSKSMKLLGVISLSEIDYERSRCQIALVCPEKTKEAPLAALESMALVTDHAFQRFGLSRVWAGQAYPGLQTWTNHLNVIGYKTEGFNRNGFKHGMFESDGVMISLLKHDYLKLINRRNGVLWPGEKIARILISKKKEFPDLPEEIHDFINQRYVIHDQRLEEIEEQIQSEIDK